MSYIRNILKKEFSGIRAKEHTEYITKFYRSPGSSGIKATTDYCRNELERYSLDKVIVEKYPVDGKTKLLGRTVYPAWEPRNVILKIIEPVEEELVNYDETPTCIAWFSTSTPPEGIVAEVVDVGKGTRPEDYICKNVNGKIVYASGGGPLNVGVRLYDLAVERFGAIGVVTDYLLGDIPGIRSRELQTDFVGLQRQPRTFNNGWTIVIPGSKGSRLRKLLNDGPVKLWALVDTYMGQGVGENLIGVIEGSEKPDEEVFVVGHLSATKPGGNCASGPALMLEAARSMAKLISEGKIPRPRRTIKFLLLCEGLGSEAYLKDHWDDRSKMIGGLCLCGVGEDQEKCKSSLVISRTPDSIHSFMNDLSEHILVDISGGKLLNSGPMRYGVDSYSPFSDNSSFNLAGVPCILLSSKPDKYFHTQYLNADKMDAEVFNVSGLITMEILYKVAQADFNMSLELASIVSKAAENRVNEFVTRAISHLLTVKSEESEEMLEKWRENLKYIVERDIGDLDSISIFMKKEDEKKRKKFNEFLYYIKKSLQDNVEKGEKKLDDINNIILGGS